MHISEGILSFPVIAAASVPAVVGVIAGLRCLHSDDLPRTALLTSAFFIASTLHIPLGVGSAHLVLNGLMGLLLGIRIFPAVLIGLFLQALLFQFGGLTVLGVNTLNIAASGWLASLVFRPLLKKNADRRKVFITGFAASVMSLALACTGLYLMLILTGRDFEKTAQLIVLAHLPVMFIEGIISGLILVALHRYQADLLS